MKLFLITALALAVVGMVIGCGSVKGRSANDGSSPITKIKAAEGKRLLEENKEIILVDVRTPAEFAEGHIPNAKLVTLDTIKDKPIAGIDKDQALIVYCRSGMRSADAARRLAAMGYTKIYDMGGIKDWPYEVVK